MRNEFGHGTSGPETTTSSSAPAYSDQELAGVDILRNLTPDQRALVASLGTIVTLPPEYILGTYRSTGDTIYLILEGTVELSVPTSMGYLAVRIVRGGESVPLSALIGEKRLVTTAVASETTRALMLSAEALAKLCLTHPDIGVRVFRTVAEIMSGRYAATLAKLTEKLDNAGQVGELWANV